MEGEGEAEEVNPFAFADEILDYTERLWGTIIYFSGLGIYLVLLLVWLALAAPQAPTWWIAIYGGGFLVLIYLPIALWKSLRLISPLKRWMDDYFEYAFIVKFELFPPRGATPTDRMLNKLAEIFPRVAELAEASPEAIQRNVALARTSVTKWDLAIDLNYPRLMRIPLVHRLLGSPSYILVKRFETADAVTVENLEHLGQTLHHDLRWRSADVDYAFIVSTGGFTPEAVSRVEEESILRLSDYSIELVVETPQGYRLAIKD